MRKSPKHTPGDWRLEMAGERPCFLMAGNIHIASMGTNAEGNGPLLRSAPDLFTAAKRALAWMDDYEASGCEEVSQSVRVELRAAIAKAKGETA